MRFDGFGYRRWGETDAGLEESPRRIADAGPTHAEVGDPDAWWVGWGKGSVTDESMWTPETPRFNQLGQQARSTLDQRSRYAAYQEMLDIWDEEAPGTVLYIPTESYGVRKQIAWKPYSYFYMDFRPQNLAFS